MKLLPITAGALIASSLTVAFAQENDEARNPFAQAPSGVVVEPTQRRFSQELAVDLVVLDVLAVDRSGGVVTDLEPSELRLFHDGEPATIDHFSPPSGRPTGARVADAARESSSRSAVTRNEGLLIVFLDQLRLLPSSRSRAVEQLEAVFAERLDPRAEVMVVTFDGVLNVRLPPTRDRKKLAQVLAAEYLFGSQRLSIHRERRDFARDIEQTLATELEILLRRSTTGTAEVREQACNTVGSYARAFAEQERGRVEATALALEEFMKSLAAYPGAKTLLHVSDGIPLIAGQDGLEHLISLCDGSAVSQGIGTSSILACCPPARFYPSAARLALQELSTAPLWSQVAAMANTHRVTLYTVQASGLAAVTASDVDGARMTGATLSGARTNDQDPLFLLADETGGRTTFDTNDLRRGFTRFLEDRSARYEVGFYPPQSVSGAHSLRLEVDRPGVRLFYRRSYTATTRDEAGAATVLAALYHRQQSNPHRVRLDTAESAGGDRRTAQVDAELRVPLRRIELIGSGEGRQGLLSVFVGARNDYGATLPIGHKQLTVTVEAGDEREDFHYVVRLPLPRGREWEVAVAVRDEFSGEISVVTDQIRLVDKSGR